MDTGHWLQEVFSSKKEDDGTIGGVVILVIVLLGIVMFLCGCDCELVRADEIDNLVPYIIEVESGGNSRAVSPAGAIGLMQITPIVLEEYIQNKEWGMYITDFETGVWYDIDGKNPNVPPLTMKEMTIGNINIRIGTWYLRHLKDHYLKDKYTVERLLCAWNGGITRLRKLNYDCSKMPKESREFTKKVLRLYKEKKL